MHVEKGKQLTEDDVIVQLFKYEPYASNGKPFKAISRVCLKRSATVEDIKKHISKSKKLNGHSHLKMRLHERKRTSGVHPLMRDDKTLSQCVKHLVDGSTKLCVRLLNVEEKVTKNDAVVIVRLWHPLKDILDRGEDVVVRKHANAMELKKSIANVFRVTMGGLSNQLYLTKSYLASANSKDLKKKMLNNDQNTTSMLRWIELPDEEEEEENTQIDGSMEAADVGGIPKPMKLKKNDIVMSTPIGGLRDGTILFMHQGNELKNAIDHWNTPIDYDNNNSDNNNNSGTNNSDRVNGKLKRKSQWNSGSIAASARTGGSFPRRGREVGIKIRTQFDDQEKKSEEDESTDKEKNMQLPSITDEAKIETSKKDIKNDHSNETIVAGGAVTAARVLQKTVVE